MMRVGKYISPGGTYLLDAGSGAIPHDEMLAYHQNYEKRICVDMSETALNEAKRKLGDRGVFILGDITKLPFKDGTIDSFVCCHAIYHVPKDDQEKVFSELVRILKSGSKGAVVYSWDKSVLEKLFRMLSKFVCLVAKAPEVVAINRGNAPGLYSWFHTRQWFTEKKWLFDYEIYSYRLLSGDFIQKVLDSSLRSRLITSMATMLESKFPKFTGKYGKYPIIQIMRK